MRTLQEAQELWETLRDLMDGCHPDYTILFRQLATVTVQLTPEATDEELLDTLTPYVLAVALRHPRLPFVLHGYRSVPRFLSARTRTNTAAVHVWREFIVAFVFPCNSVTHRRPCHMCGLYGPIVVACARHGSFNCSR